MSRSQIIKDIANSTIDVSTALKRTKVLLSAFDSPELLNWVNYELTGYPEDAKLPDYRVLQGELVGSYVLGTVSQFVTHKNVSIPLGTMPDDLRDNLLTVPLYDGIGSLSKLLEKSQESSGSPGKVVPADFFPIIAKYNSNPFLRIISASVHFGEQRIQSVFSSVESRLLDILLILEKEFGSLDELDIDLSEKNQDEVNAVVNKLVVIVYDNSVCIGDKNKIVNSEVASTLEK